ncbi:MAG TPA: hypothetical protein VF677_03535 [Flavobacterium sp.]|jgi:hypothetical protein
MKAFYTKLIETFEKPSNKQLFLSQNISPVGYIDLYAGQDQFEDNFELFAQPALLVDWNIDHSGDVPAVNINFYCCYEQLRDTSNRSLNRYLGLKFLDYVATVDQIVRGIESEATGKMELVTEGFNKMDSIVDIYLLTYTCNGKKLKSPQQYEEGTYDTLKLQTNLTYDID